MMPNYEELDIPDEVKQSRRALELARIWLADSRQVVVISQHLWEDPSAWGLMLVDLAKHLGNSYITLGYSPEETINKIRNAMDIEWNNPTD
jgi:hypothetical protein